MPDAFSQLVTAEPTAPLIETVLFKHRHAMLIRDLPGFDPSVRQATGSTIAEKIGDLITEQRAARLEAETLRRRREDKGADILL